MKKSRNMVVVNVAMAAADTEYEYQFPANVERFTMGLRDQTKAWRFSNLTSKVATPTEPYKTMPAGAEYEEQGLIMPIDNTVYFASGDAAQVMEIVFWTAAERN